MNSPTRTVGITGATGLLGTELTPQLAAAGHRVIRLSRSASQRKAGGGSGETGSWEPSSGNIAAPEPIQTVVHLAGESIAGGRWTNARKQAIRDSRVDATRRLCEGLARRTP